MAGARGQIQDISPTYRTMEKETETYKYSSKTSEGEIDVDKTRREMKKEFVEFN